MDELFIEVDDTSDIEFQVINKIKEQAPNILDLHDMINPIVEVWSHALNLGFRWHKQQLVKQKSNN